MNKKTAVIITIFILFLGGIVWLYNQQNRKIPFILKNENAKSALVSGAIKAKEQSLEEIKTSEKVNNDGNLISKESTNSLNKSDVNIELDKDIFSEVNIGQTAADEWVINLKNLSDDKKQDAKKKVLSVLDKIETEFNTESKLGLVVKSPIGIVTIKKQGVLINRILANMLSNIGIREEDVIKSINNQEVNSLKDIYSVYKTIKSNPTLALFSVEYERNGILMSSKYIVK